MGEQTKINNLMHATQKTRAFRRVVLAAVIIPFLLISVAGYLAHKSLEATLNSTQSVNRSNKIEIQLETLLSALKDAETGQRGFVLTNNDAYLEPFYSAEKRFPELIATLKELLSTSPIMESQIQSLEKLSNQKFGEMLRTIELQRKGKKREAISRVKAGFELATMTKIRRVVRALLEQQNILLLEHEAKLQQTLLNNSNITWLLISIQFVFFICILFLLRNLERYRSLLTMCAWSKSVEYEGQWISFEEYLLRKFDISVSHGISPKEAEKLVTTGYSHTSKA